MAIEMPASDLSRAKVSEPDQTWPMELRVVASWGKNRATSFVITMHEYFGLGQFGAPMNGDTLMQRIERLRRAGAPQ